MKNSILLFTTFLFILASCGKSDKLELTKDENKSCVEILYFHGDMRCKNCYAMEKGVSQLLNDQFKDEVKDGKIVFRTIDITTPDGEKIADNYCVAWSSLYLNYWKDGKEERNDLTRIGMKTASKNPTVFKEEVKNYIHLYLSE